MTGPVESPALPAIAAPPLVGRARELGLLHERLAAALAGRGGLVLLGGEAGIGKTALAEAVCGQAITRGALVLIGRCYDLSETPPYGPWAEALARVPHGGDGPAPPDLAGGVGAASQAALFGQVRDYLAAVAARRPLVLLLDDLHWADPASLDLLRVLGRQLAGVPALLLVTYRADELTRHHPLYALLPVLEREARATRLDLRPLDQAALRGLVARYALPAGDTARLAAWLAGRAEGNAFFTAQLLRALEDEGTLAETTDRWALGDLGGVGLPTALRQVLDARVDRLGEAARQHLTLAAVIGQDVPLALWATVAETGEEALLETIEPAVEAHLLSESPDGTAVRFPHALIREALYAGLLATRRRRVHQRAGEALAALAGADPDAVAYHFQRAGDARAAEWLIRAGERAERAYAWLTAADRFEAALALLETGDGDPGRRAALLVHLAQMRRYADPAQGVAALEEAARLAHAAGKEALAAAALFDQGHLRCLAGDFARGLARMAAALPALEALPATERAGLPTSAILGGPPAERAHHHRGTLVQYLAYMGRYAEARAASERPGRAPGRTARELSGLGSMYAVLGEPARAREAFAAAVETFGAAGQHHEVGSMLWADLVAVILPYRADRPAERRRLAAEAEAAWARGSGAQPEPPRVLALPMLYLDGRWAEAREVALAALRVERGFWRVHGRYSTGALAHAQGDSDLAWRCVQEVLPDGPAATPGDAVYSLALAAEPLAAALALDAGDLDAARAWLAAHDRWLAWGGAVLGRAEGQLGWAAYHRAVGALDAAREHAAMALRDASDPRQPLALLAAHRALGELDTEAERHADAAAHLDAALALADACAAPYERALTLLATAELRAATGEREAAGATLDEARAILEPLEAKPAIERADALAARLTPTATPAPAYPAGLSAREAEVLRLVAQGLTNAQVAERLYLSPRTIDQHLRSIYTKLGVSSRSAATAFAIDHGLR
ncbi:MAG TPA: AAA family ATPase [Thermomicrobiales bacterium]|nr:AAA family ATPase [Thermomicrobiales bacterium]